MTVQPMRRFGIGRPRPVAVLAIAILLVLGFGLGATQAQDTQQIITHPAHIHVGTCAELDPNPVAPLNDVAPRGFDAESGEMADPEEIETRGSLSAPPVLVSKSEADISFDDVLDSAHAINVHESAENIDNYIACGDIGGQVFDDELYIALHEQNDSGYFGIAILEPGDDDKTEVTIYLASPPSSGGEAPAESPEATPEG